MIDKPSPSQCPPFMTPASECPSTSTVPLSANRVTDISLPAFGIDKDVRLFLASCNPPLVHLAGVFADIGCVTQQHLINITDFASGDKLARYASLKVIFAGRGVKDTEIMAIQKQLDFAQ
ncbi:hypothetical protein CPC08DRAFT_716122 [Agrocybe pediades]|nr:hypothetical protein CPC08DRAFT_716122 [Agrocybe pediades]